MYSKNLKKSGAQRGSGFVRFWHEVHRGARRILFRIPKKITIIRLGHGLAACGQENFQNRRANAKQFEIQIQFENFQTGFSNSPKYIVFFRFLSRFSRFQRNVFFRNQNFRK